MKHNKRSLVDYLDSVRDRETFLDFVWALVKDREDSVKKEEADPSSPFEPDANGWENITIERFFEAALAWATDSGKLPEEASWKAFAEFLYCGKIYE